MAARCLAPPDGAGFLAGALDFIDCQAQSIGEAGYAALAQPSSSGSLLLSALLTLFIALFGIRLLFGRPVDAGDVMLGAVKLGIVLMLASSWAGFRVTAYDLVLKAPAELAATVGGAAGLPGTTGGLTQRLQGADNALLTLIDAGTGRQDPASVRQAPIPGEPPLAKAPLSDDLAFGFGRVIFLSTIIGALGLTRLAAGVLLALAPLFAGFLLFDATRSLFTGWVRMLAGLSLAAFAVAVTISVQLAALEPWLAQLLTARANRLIVPAAPIELLVIALVFATVAFGMIAIALKLSFAPVAVGGIWRHVGATALPSSFSGSAVAPADRRGPDAGAVSRAQQVSEALVARQRQEQAVMLQAQIMAASGGPSPTRMPGLAPVRSATAAVPLGRSYPAASRTKRRVSSAADQRSRRP